MNQLQTIVRQFCQKHGLDSSPEHRSLDVLSELGEVAKEILKMSDYGRKPAAPTSRRQELKAELGDLLYSLITLANSFDINLEKALEAAFKKYEQRLRRHGSAGSNKSYR